MKTACNVHDAGYRGATVADPFATTTDFRTWTRTDMDAKFLRDLQTLCAAHLTGKPKLIKKCDGEAAKYHWIVRKWGKSAFDADVTVSGVRSEVPARTIPTGGARDNR